MTYQNQGDVRPVTPGRPQGVWSERKGTAKHDHQLTPPQLLSMVLKRQPTRELLARMVRVSLTQSRALVMNATMATNFQS